MRVALLSHNARAGDAIGNQVAEKLTFFLDRGAEVRVFVECDRSPHPAVRRGGRPARASFRCRIRRGATMPGSSRTIGSRPSFSRCSGAR